MKPPNQKFGSARWCRPPSATVARRRELWSSTREVDESLKEKLIPCWVTENSRVTSVLKITTTETTFLSVKSTAESQHARTSIKRTRKRCQLCATCPRSTRRIPTLCIVAIKRAWARMQRKSVDMHACSMQNMEKVCRYACMQYAEHGKRRERVQVVIIGVVTWSLFTPERRIYIFLSFTCRLFICLSNNPPPLFPLRVSWAWIEHNFFPVVSYFFFLSFAFHRRKKPCYHVIDDVCVRVCAKAALKDKPFFFAPNFLSLGRTIATKIKENATRKMAPGSSPKNSATGTEKIFRALLRARLSWLSTPAPTASLSWSLYLTLSLLFYYLWVSLMAFSMRLTFHLRYWSIAALAKETQVGDVDVKWSCIHSLQWWGPGKVWSQIVWHQMPRLVGNICPEIKSTDKEFSQKWREMFLLREVWCSVSVLCRKFKWW